MARYTGPKTKIARKLGEPIFGEDKVLAKKNYPPGQHGQNRRRKQSEYGTQLREKQKAKYTYGVLERQFRNLFKKASAMKGVTGEVLLQLLEQRLDNMVYRLGIAPSRAAARQLVLHRHIVVDGGVVNIPSYRVDPGQVVAVREKQKAKYTYGVLERQFRNLFKKASSMKGVTGEVLLQLLEQRLDNVVYRLGIAPTRAAARQLVLHRHIVVDGGVVNIPSYRVEPGQVVAVREKSKSLEVIQDALAGFNHSKYPWIEWDENVKGGKLLHLPQREDIPENIKEQLIVELYSKQ